MYVIVHEDKHPASFSRLGPAGMYEFFKFSASSLTALSRTLAMSVIFMDVIVVFSVDDSVQRIGMIEDHVCFKLCILPVLALLNLNESFVTDSCCKCYVRGYRKVSWKV